MDANEFDFSSKKGVLVVKFAFATAILKIETLRMRRRFARVSLPKASRANTNAKKVFMVILLVHGLLSTSFRKNNALQISVFF